MSDAGGRFRRLRARDTSSAPRTRPARAPIVFVVVAAFAAAVIADQVGADRDDTSVATLPASGPAIPNSDALSVSWYCAEGTGDPEGRADETVALANLGDTDAEAIVTVLAGADGEPARRRVDVPARGQTEVEVSGVLDAPEEIASPGVVSGPGVVVEAFGGQVIVEHVIQRNDDVAVGPCARAPSSDWYFAGGTTVRGTEMFLSLFNPFGDDAVVDVTFLTDTGVQTPEDVQALVVPRRSRVSVVVHDEVRRQTQVATAVHARTGRVVAEQSLAFDGTEGPLGITLSLGATAPARSWTFPFGAAAEGRAQTVSVVNPSETSTEVEVSTVLDGDETVAPQTVPVPARTVASVEVGTGLDPGTEYAVDVRATGNAPVVAEELFTTVAPSESGAALDFGVTAPATRWAFSGIPAADADAVISVLNPSGRPVTVTLLAYTEGDVDSPRSAPERALGAGERTSFTLSELGIAPDQVLLVESDGEVFAERLVLTATGRSLDPGVPARAGE
jgi:hypothetical protein